MKYSFNLNPKFIMLPAEIDQYTALPDNMPDINLTAKQKELISSLYYKYITRLIDNQAYNLPLYKSEQKEKWPSGPRVKEFQSKRFILNQLLELQRPDRIKMTSDQAAKFFFAAFHWRPFCQVVIKSAYQSN